MKRDSDFCVNNVPEKESQDEGDGGDGVGSGCREGGRRVVDGHVEEVKTQSESGLCHNTCFLNDLIE